MSRKNPGKLQAALEVSKDIFSNVFCKSNEVQCCQTIWYYLLLYRDRGEFLSRTLIFIGFQFSLSSISFATFFLFVCLKKKEAVTVLNPFEFYAGFNKNVFANIRICLKFIQRFLFTSWRSNGIYRNLSWLVDFYLRIN